MDGCILVKCLLVLVVSVVSDCEENVIRFHTADRRRILDAHNDLRRSIYNAANMRELTWNHAVAHAAAEWGQKCEYLSRPDNQWGQNMNYFHGPEAKRDTWELFRTSFHAWSNETQHYDYRRYRYCGSKHVCSYVQLIAADVQEVGCSIVKCPRLTLREPEGVAQNAKLLVCFYTPWVDITGTEIFIPHDRCSACPPATQCVDNLCSTRFSSNTPVKSLPSIGAASVNVAISSLSGSSATGSMATDAKKTADTVLDIGQNTNQDRQRGSRRHGINRNRHKDQQTTGDNNRAVETFLERTSNPETLALKGQSESIVSGNQSTIIYTPNNRVEPFPGRQDSRDVRRIERLEMKLKREHSAKGQNTRDDTGRRHRTRDGHAELVAKPATVVDVKDNVTVVVDKKNRTKRQVDPRYYDARYLRRQEYDRWVRQERARILRDRSYHERYREELRRNHAELRRRHSDAHRVRQEHEERSRLMRERERRHRLMALALRQDEDSLKSEEQFNVISIHNMLRREAGTTELAWSSHLERWARYVIRCDTEYPGPITCYTNFGKADQGEDIYNVVYRWGSEGDDVYMPLRYGCRTPYDKSRCNHNTIMINPKLTQVACAAKSCGSQRQLTCIYNSV